MRPVQFGDTFKVLYQKTDGPVRGISFPAAKGGQETGVEVPRDALESLEELVGNMQVEMQLDSILSESLEQELGVKNAIVPITDPDRQAGTAYWFMDGPNKDSFTPFEALYRNAWDSHGQTLPGTNLTSYTEADMANIETQLAQDVRSLITGEEPTVTIRYAEPSTWDNAKSLGDIILNLREIRETIFKDKDKKQAES